MDIRRKVGRIVKRTNPDEADDLARLGVVAPQCDPTLGAAGDLLTFATVRRRVNDLYISLEQLHAIGFHERVEREGGSGFPLAPATVAAMDDQWPCYAAIAHEATGTAAVERRGMTAH
jgi:hypothetical protein